MRKNLGIFPVLLLLLLFGSDFFTSSCASRSAPSGGPRDTAAPKLDTSFPPNFTTSFTAKEVRLVFNEYITLKSPSQQISFSPPLKRKPEITSRSKEVLISWTDTLLDSTTYTISFGNSITDFTEGNVNDNFKYVFSTGDFIDSLELHGRVVDSKTSAGDEEMLVALYDYSQLHRTDSIPYLNMPTYYTYTDEAGNFSLSNLKYGNFHVVAFKDSRGSFKLSTGSERFAFLGDTLSLTDTTEAITLHSFLPRPKPRAYSPRHVAKGQIQFPFNYQVDSLKISTLDTANEDLMEPFVRFNNTRDTAFYWFERGDRDSIRFVVQATGQEPDTPVVYLRNFNTPALILSAISKEVKFDEPVSLKSNLPLSSVFYDDMQVFTTRDTVGVDSVEHDDPLRIVIEPQKRSKEFSLYLKKGTVRSAYGNENDSLLLQFTNLTREDLGTLNITIETDSSTALVLVIRSPEKKEVYRMAFWGDHTVKLQNRKPGVYGMELIIDRNNDGEWTTGNYLERRQPERIIQHKDQAEIRANWDMELLWKPDQLN